MLKILSQGWVSGGYDVVLSNKRRLHLHIKNPTQEQLNNFLIEYERSLLNNIDLKGEEGDVYSNESNIGRTDSGEDPTLGIS